MWKKIFLTLMVKTGTFKDIISYFSTHTKMVREKGEVLRESTQKNMSPSVDALSIPDACCRFGLVSQTLSKYLGCLSLGMSRE